MSTDPCIASREIVRRVAVAILAIAAPVVCRSLRAEEAFIRLPLRELKITDGALPDWTGASMPSGGSSGWARLELMLPRLLIEGPGEAYYRHPADGPVFELAAVSGGSVVFHLPESRDVKGKILVPRADWSGMASLPFAVEASRATPEAKLEFYLAKADYFEDLLSQNPAGAAWFRHQADAARKELAALGQSRPGNERQAWWRRPRAGELEETYSVFTGGRALSENLQLDRLLPPVKDDDLTVDIASLEGITVAAIDWKPLLKGAKPAIDPLASLIPDDQHALFFSSFSAMIDLLDEADANGTPILQLLEPRAEDARTRERYERQLCMGMSDLGRLLGPAVVASVAFTGSDSYLRVGSDVAIIFEARAPDVLRGFVEAKQAAAAKGDAGAKKSQGEIDGVAYASVVTPDRTISSYLATLGKNVVVTNSMAQLRRIIDVSKGKKTALASTDEYAYFRDRYPLADKEETAFLILTDATIRRWCSPLWRIADSRRTRVAAALTDLQAAHVDEVARGTAKEGEVSSAFMVPGAGAFRMTRGGPTSGTYGSLAFMTPISELGITKATKEEASAYTRFRETYQQNWRRFFDPIAIRFTARREKVGLDLTVMPLIEGTEYRELIDITRGAEIGPKSGDPHDDALLHVALAVNPDSETIGMASGFVSSMVPGVKAKPLAWLGGSVSVYFDEDPVWEELRKKKDELPRLFERSFARLPVALRCEVKDVLGLTGFLAVLRGFVEQSAPGLTAWETRTYKERPYVRVSASERAKADGEVPSEAADMAIYYAAGGGGLVVSLREDVLQRALDRQIARTVEKAAGEKAAAPPATAWLGASVAARVQQKGLEVLEAMGRENLEQESQEKAWSNIPILNEWKRRFPDSDPVQLHERLWGVRLLCPGGGQYVWNEEWRTMESTVYGHPGKPKNGSAYALPISKIGSASVGLSFERMGLRARVQIDRKP